MEVRYNAFISYRHHPEDIRVAEEIHRLLERFRIPRALKKQTGGITRLFRDKDELPITSNLSDDIFMALRNSDYLIVICSTHTKESIWVQREIETFLTTHDRSKVLTVLVNGEPYEVIPEILLYEDVTDPETGETSRVALEPLSCDWRVEPRKARREELPRLAAALLHCTYDELRQRQKQYRMQQMLTFGSVALAASLALAVYFLYTTLTIRDANIQIQENYTQALKNQSQFLSTAAQTRMDAGDRLTALALLLEALPGEGNDRPYVAAAEHTLTEALFTYASGNNIAARGVLEPDPTSIVTDLYLSDDGQLIYLVNGQDKVTIWDAETLQCKATINPDLSISRFHGITAEGNILLYISGQTGGILGCYQPDGSLLWQQENYSDTAFLDGKSVLLAHMTRYTQESSAPQIDAELILFLDPATGEALREPIELPPTEGAGYYHFLLPEFQTGQPLLLYHGSLTDGYYLYQVSPDTGEARLLLESANPTETACLLDNGTVLLMTSDGSGMMNGWYGNMLSASPARYDLLNYDLSSGELLWQSKLETHQYTGTYTLLPVPDSSAILCQAGSTMQLISSQDGQLLQRCETASGIVDISDVSASSAFGVLMDGGLVTYYFQDNECRTLYYDIASNLRQAKLYGALYALPMQASQVTVYSSMTPDYLWETQLVMPEDESSYASYATYHLRMAGNLLAFENTTEFCLYDLTSQEYVWRVAKPEFGRLIGFSGDHSQLWISWDSKTLAAFDTSTGDKTLLEIPQTRDENRILASDDYVLSGGKVWYLAYENQQLHLVALDPESGTAAYLPFLSDGSTFYSRILSITQAFAWLLGDDGTLYTLPLAGGDPLPVAEGLAHTAPLAHRPSDGLTAVGCKNQILLCTPDGQVTQAIGLEEGEEAGSLYFLGEDLACLLHSGYLLRFSPEGTLLAQTGLTVSGHLKSSFTTSLPEPLDILWHETGDGKLIQFAYGMVNIVDLATWERSADISCQLYHPGTDVFLREHNGLLRAIPRYSLEDLTQIARKQLDSFTLTQEIRDAYGLN